MSDPDSGRPASVLTNAQRDWLRGDKDYRPSTEREMKARVKERARSALADFQLLNEHLDEADEDWRSEIFEVEKSEQTEFEGRISHLITFLYAGMGGPQRFMRVLRNGVKNGEVALGNTENALLVDFDPDAPEVVSEVGSAEDLKRVIAHLEGEDGDPTDLSPAEVYGFLRIAAKADAIEMDEVEGWITAIESASDID